MVFTIAQAFTRVYMSVIRRAEISATLFKWLFTDVYTRYTYQHYADEAAVGCG